MVWRILQGLFIHKLEMKYVEQREFSLVVTLTKAADERQNGNLFVG